MRLRNSNHNTNVLSGLHTPHYVIQIQ